MIFYKIQPFNENELMKDTQQLISSYDYLKKKYPDIRLSYDDLKKLNKQLTDAKIGMKKEVLSRIYDLFGEYLTWRIINSDKNIVKTYAIKPYKYVQENDCLFGLICHVDNPYKGGIEDTSIHLFEDLEKYTIEIESITEEKFMEYVNETIQHCIKHRNEKVKNS